ncbi:probable exported protein [Psychrobacter sp. JCM 18900]|nr:probable exported protein [Psychrobacter sp. JCM 18900]
MLSQLLPMLAITFTVFVLFFIFMGVGYMVKKSRLEDLVAVLPN